MSDPERSDIVVFSAPGNAQDDPPLIKRVIGLPGERVELRNDRVYIDGEVLVEIYMKESCRPARC